MGHPLLCAGSRLLASSFILLAPSSWLLGFLTQLVLAHTRSSAFAFGVGSLLLFHVHGVGEAAALQQQASTLQRNGPLGHGAQRFR
jgi:hypothetical protein